MCFQCEAREKAKEKKRWRASKEKAVRIECGSQITKSAPADMSPCCTILCWRQINQPCCRGGWGGGGEECREVRLGKGSQKKN